MPEVNNFSAAALTIYKTLVSQGVYENKKKSFVFLFLFFFFDYSVLLFLLTMPRQVPRRTPVDPSTPVTGAPQQHHQRQPPPVRNTATAGAPVFETPPGFQFPPDAVHPRRGVETLVGALPAWQLPPPPQRQQQQQQVAGLDALAAAAADGRGRRESSHMSELGESTEGDENNNFDARGADQFNGVIQHGDGDEEDVIDEGDEDEEDAEEEDEEDEEEEEDEEMHDRRPLTYIQGL